MFWFCVYIPIICANSIPLCTPLHKADGASIVINKHNGLFHVDDGGGFQTRHSSVIKLFELADLPDFCPILITTNDRPDCSRRSMSWCSDCTNVVPIPTYVFWHWKEAGIHDFDAVSTQIDVAGCTTPRTNKLGWIGNLNTNPIRVKLFGLGRQYSTRLDIRDIYPENDGRGYNIKTSSFMTLPEQVREWKYLIDIEGMSFSGRLPLLLHSGRLLFYQHESLKQWFDELFIPWVHYIPVKSDLSDLFVNLDWADTHPIEVSAIISNCTAMARLYVTRAGALRYLHKAVSHFYD